MKNYTLKIGEIFTEQKEKELKEYLEAKDEEIAQLRLQLAGCAVAALGGKRANVNDYGWSPSYQDVLNLRLKYENLIGTKPDPEA